MKNLTLWTALTDSKIVCYSASVWRIKMNSLVLMDVITQPNNSHLRVMRVYALLIDSKKTTLWSALTSFPSPKNQAQGNNLDYQWIQTKTRLKVKIATTVWRLNRTKLLTYQGWWTATIWALHPPLFPMPHRTCFHLTEFIKWVNSILTLLNFPNNSW